MVGDGPDRQALIKLSKRLNIADRVIFLSYVKNPGEILTKADIFVMASHAEPFGLATADAREAGCAIVGTSVGGTPELLDFGKDSVLVKPESPERDRSSTRQADVGSLQAFRAGSKSGSEYYRAARVAKDYAKVHASLLPRANSP